MNKRLCLFCSLLFGWMAFILTGCSLAAQPAQIAAYPLSTPIVRYPSQIAPQYSAFLEIQVADLERALQEAYRQTAQYGGLVINSSSWERRATQYVTLEVIVPTETFESLRQDFKRLGVLIQESAVAEWIEPAPLPPGMRWSQITLQLHAQKAAWPPLKTPGWNPVNTFQRAFGVFMAIFGFIVDLLIWILVVAGPFLLIAGLIAWLIRRRSKSRAAPPMESPGSE